MKCSRPDHARWRPAEYRKLAGTMEALWRHFAGMEAWPGRAGALA